MNPHIKIVILVQIASTVTLRCNFQELTAMDAQIVFPQIPPKEIMFVMIAKVVFLITLIVNSVQGAQIVFQLPLLKTQLG